MHIRLDGIVLFTPLKFHNSLDHAALSDGQMTWHLVELIHIDTSLFFLNGFDCYYLKVIFSITSKRCEDTICSERCDAMFGATKETERKKERQNMFIFHKILSFQWAQNASFKFCFR